MSQNIQYIFFRYVNSSMFLQDWRFNVLGQVNQTNVQLLDQVEEIAYQNLPSYNPYDAFATAAFLFPKQVIQVMKPFNATIELAGRETRGEMIVNRQSTVYNVNVVQKISQKAFMRIQLRAAKFQ